MLSKEQQQGFMEVLSFINDPNNQFMFISGGPGTGKTYFISQVANSILRHKSKTSKLNKVAVTATTNKAVAVISEAMPNTSLEISTIYSYMNLRVQENFSTGEVKVIPTNKFKVRYDELIIIDECSMIDSNLLKYLQMGISKSCKILFIGDKNQLAPIKEPLSPIYNICDRGFEFTQPVRNADQPALMEICEQGKQTVLTGQFKPIREVPGVIDLVDGVTLKGILEREFRTENTTKRVLSYTNKRVLEYNSYIRKVRGYQTSIAVGEILFNNENCEVGKDVRLYTDQMLETIETSKPYECKNIFLGYSFEMIDVTLRDLTYDTLHQVTIFKDIQDRREILKELARTKDWHEYFYIKKTYPDLRPSAASTTHKAQGSTYDSVVVDLADIGRCTNKDQTARLLYVALSRPKKRLFIRGVLPERYFQ